MPPEAFSNILACKSLGSWEYIGRMARAGASSNSPSRSIMKEFKIVLIFLFIDFRNN